MMIYATATRPGSGLVAITLLCSAALFAGCSVSTRVTSTSRSSIEQRLLVRSVERAFAQVSTERLKGKTVALEVYGLTGNRDFVKELLAAQLRERGLELAGKPETGDGRLKLFITGSTSKPEISKRSFSESVSNLIREAGKNLIQEQGRQILQKL